MWEDLVRELVGPKDNVAVVRATSVTTKLARASGLLTYFGELVREVKRLRKELDERHGKKNRLLSDLLKRKPKGA